MTTFPGSPRLLKGALVTLNSAGNTVESTIAFQYNPETLIRKLQARAVAQSNDAPAEALRLEGAPKENITLTVKIDATDQLEKAENSAVQLGIYPQLSALELLLYPTSQQISQANQDTARGVLEITPIVAPLTLLIWGEKRVLPVRLTGFTITEQAYDINLHPIRAEVALSLDVMTYNDLRWDTRGAKLFFTHHQQKEQIAVQGRASNGAQITGVRV
jgi:Contractile injection system tube protein